MRAWTFYNRRYGERRIEALELHWEAHCSAMSVDYDPRETSATELWREWIKRYGAPEVKIHWFVVAPDGRIFEAAPFGTAQRNFLDFYTWPEDQAGNLLRWTDLPVVNYRWTRRRADKGGFIQQATGWKPSPLQPTMPVAVIAAACGLPSPS